MAKNEIRLHSDTIVRLPHPLDVSDPSVPLVFTPTVSIFYLLYSKPRTVTTAEATTASPATVLVEDVTGFQNGDLLTYWEESGGTLARVTSTITNTPEDDGNLQFNLANTLQAGATIYKMVQLGSLGGNLLYGTPDVNTTNWGRYGTIPWDQTTLVKGDEITIMWALTDASSNTAYQFSEHVVLEG